MRATRDNGTAAGSQITRASDRRISNSAAATPGSSSGTRSTSHTHDAQCTPSRYRSTWESPSARGRTYSVRNASWSNSSYVRPVGVTDSSRRSPSR